RLVAPGGEAQYADEEALGTFADGAGQRAVAADRGPDLAAQPLLELGEVGDGERLDLDGRDVVVAPGTRRAELRPVDAFDRGARGRERREPPQGLGAGARADEEALIERLVGDDGGPGVRGDQVVEEAVAPELDAEAEPDRQAGADGLLERGLAEQRAEAEDGPVAGARFGGQGERRLLLRPRRRGGEGQRPGEEQDAHSRGPTRTKKFTPSAPPPSGTAQ